MFSFVWFYKILQGDEVKKEKEKKEKDKEKDDESTKDEGNVTVKIEKLGDAGLKTDMYAKHLATMKVSFFILTIKNNLSHVKIIERKPF